MKRFVSDTLFIRCNCINWYQIQQHPQVIRKYCIKPKVRIRTYGNTAFTSTMGLSGTRFNQLPQRYFLKGDKLAAQDADPYSLVLSSLFNLSFDFNWSVSPVLSLGIGVPVTNSEYVDNITF